MVVYVLPQGALADAPGLLSSHSMARLLPVPVAAGQHEFRGASCRKAAQKGAAAVTASAYFRQGNVWCRLICKYRTQALCIVACLHHTLPCVHEQVIIFVVVLQDT